MPMVLAIVGAGRVGRALGKRLRDRGWRIGAVVTRSGATARAAVRAIGAGRALRNFAPVLFNADVLLIATPDSAIAPVAARLAFLGGDVGKGKVVLHTSGALDHRVLAPLAECGASTGSMHPFQTFGARAIPNLKGVLFAVEGDPRAVRIAQRIARSLGGVPIRVSPAAKPAYHAAGGFAAAHTLALIEAAKQMLVALGFPPRQALRSLLLMARQTLDNLERLGPRAALTGPVSRGDFATVAKHFAALRRFPPEFRAAHAALLLLSARVLAADRRAALRRLARILKDQPPSHRGTEN